MSANRWVFSLICLSLILFTMVSSQDDNGDEGSAEPIDPPKTEDSPNSTNVVFEFSIPVNNKTQEEFVQQKDNEFTNSFCDFIRVILRGGKKPIKIAFDCDIKQREANSNTLQLIITVRKGNQTAQVFRLLDTTDGLDLSDLDLSVEEVTKQLSETINTYTEELHAFVEVKSVLDSLSTLAIIVRNTIVNETESETIFAMEVDIMVAGKLASNLSMYMNPVSPDNDLLKLEVCSFATESAMTNEALKSLHGVCTLNAQTRTLHLRYANEQLEANNLNVADLGSALEKANSDAIKIFEENTGFNLNGFSNRISQSWIPLLILLSTILWQ